MVHARRCLVIACLALVALSGRSVAHADERVDVVVKKGSLGEAIELKGAIVPARYERVACEPKAYGGPFEVVEAVPEGPVVKGQTLVRFDDEKYKEQLRDRERAVAEARNRLQKAELDARLKDEETAAAMDELVQKKRLADEALERFESVERKLLEEGKVYGFEGRQIQIQNMREELAQLEKMYKEDDLTEETEEIVLKRNKRNFERMLQSFEWAKKRHEYDMQVDLPRQHEGLRMAARKMANSLRRFQESLPLDEEAAQMGLEKAREDFASAEEALADFRADGDVLTVKAPRAGYAVRGTFDGGTWKSLGEDEAYRPGEKGFKAQQTLYTLLDESVLRVETSLKEADLAHVKAGLRATVTTPVTGDKPFEAEIAVVARYGKGGSYAMTLRLEGTDPLLRAGLGCNVTIPRADGEDVLSVPETCVLTEKDASFVFVTDGAGDPVKTEVKLGRKSGGRVELTSGVSAGQHVLATPPKAK